MTTAGMPLRSVVTLTIIGLLAAVILAGMNHVTGERIEHKQQTRALAAIAEMLPADSYDNELLDDRIEVDIDGFDRPARVYRARLSGEPVAMVVDLTTPRGYSGDIRLLVAVDVAGTVMGVQVLEHRETPGLGDRIEPRRTDWLKQFVGRSLADPEPEGWAPDRRGGEFDTLTSATITVAAIVEAVKRALQAVELNESEPFTHKASTDTLSQ